MISSPPVTHSCFYGIDTPSRKKLIAANHSVEEIRELISAESLNYLSEEDLAVVICKLPMYKTYHGRENPDILRRRDSVLQDALQKYPKVKLLDLETDTINFKVTDYWNQSHLNPDGAIKFTERLNELLNSLN